MADSTPKAARDSVVDLYQSGMLPEAESQCRELLSRHPDDHEVLQILGMALASQRRWGEAIGIFRKIVALSPGNAWALRNAPWIRPASLGTEDRAAESSAVGVAFNMAVRRVLAETRVNCVIDVGANEGQFARHVRALGFGGRIVSLEPASAPFRVLSEFAARDGNWSAMQLAAGRHAGEATLSVFPQSVYNTLRPTEPQSASSTGPNPAGGSTELVTVRPLDELWDQLVAKVTAPSVYLKIDAQGFDAEALAGATARVIPSSAALQIELSLRPTYAGAEPWWETLQKLLASGWGVVGIYPVARLQSDYTTVDVDCLLTRAGTVGTTMP